MTKPLWGLADTHAHFMAELECGGQFFWGNNYSKVRGSADHQLRNALRPRDGRITIGLLEEGTTGYPTFDHWPRFTTLFYQQAYIDWIKRAYEGGLRLVSCLCVNNESFTHRLYGEESDIPNLAQLIGRVFLPTLLPYDNNSVISNQLKAAKSMVEYVANHDGGWMQIAYSPEEARAIISEDKLALVLGIEVDSLGNWRTEADLRADAQRQKTDVRTVIRCELERLHQAGVRQITPIHLCNNPFGGAAVYNVLFNTVNVDITGMDFDVEEAFDAGIRYRIDKDTGEPSPRFLLEILGLLEIESSLPFSEFRQRIAPLKSHRNRLGLTDYGVMLIEEMMRLGMVIDLDHMSDHSKERTLKIATDNHYPLIHSHAFGFRDMALTADVPFTGDAPKDQYHTSHVQNLASEFHATKHDLETVRDLGGMVSVMLNQGEVRDFDGPNGIKQTATATIDNNCSGSSRSWAQAYLYASEVMGDQSVGIGTDVNGLARLPAPRFGTDSAFRLDGDSFRDPDKTLRLHQAEAQENGVRYSEPIEYTWRQRFGGTAYDGDGDSDMSRDVWRAVGLFKADVQPTGEERAENIAFGLQAGKAGDDSQLDCGFLRGDCSDQRRAGYLVTSGVEPTEADSDAVRSLYGKILNCLRRWEAMDGNNEAIPRSFVGERDYDYNIDGFAHYGMMRDFLQDVRNIGLQDPHMDALYHTAETYVSTWEKCVARSAELFGKIVIPSTECGAADE